LGKSNFSGIDSRQKKTPRSQDLSDFTPRPPPPNKISEKLTIEKSLKKANHTWVKDTKKCLGKTTIFGGRKNPRSTPKKGNFSEKIRKKST
jgi:hypothetical protein